MNIRQLSKSLPAAILLFACGTTFAQRAGSGAVWKKQVFRILDLKEKEDSKEHHLKDASPDTTLTEMIVTAIRQGKIAAYSNFDHSFTTRLSLEELNAMLVPVPDTQVVVNPIDGSNHMQIIRHDFDYDVVHKYRLLEDWSFNPMTGKTEIQITGICPVKEIYGDNGDFRGLQAIFWLKYPDVANIIARYEQYHPNNTIASKIWNDYFLSDTKPEGQK